MPDPTPVTTPVGDSATALNNDVDPIDYDPSLWTLISQEPHLYQPSQDRVINLDYVIFNHYEKDYHRYALPLTSPTAFQGKKCAVVQLAADVLFLISEWTTATLFDKPKIPNPNSLDPRWVLLDEQYKAVMQNAGNDGLTPLWRIEGVYVYVCLSPNELTINDVAFPRAPYFRDAYDRAASSAMFESNVLDASSSSSVNAVPIR